MIKYRCIDLFGSASLKKAKVLAGEKYLEKHVRWAHVAELSETITLVPEHIVNHDVLIISGPILNSSSDSAEDVLGQLVDVAIKASLSAVLVYQREYLREIPVKIIRKAEKAKLPLIFILEPLPPITNLICEITFGIMNNDRNRMREENILMDIITNDIRDERTFYTRAEFHKYDLRAPHQGMYIRCCHNIDKKRTGTDKSRQNKLDSGTTLQRICTQTLSRYYQKPLTIVEQDACVCLLPKNQSIFSASNIANQIIDDIHSADASCRVTIGIGGMEESLSGFSRSIADAKQIVNVMKILNMTDECRTIEDMAVPVFLLEQAGHPLVEMVYQQILQKLNCSDCTDGQELMRTLDVFFDCNKNINITSDRLFIHRNTLRSRLQRIEYLLQKELSNAGDCFEIQLALYVYKLIQGRPD